jgi:hypothetical protein
VYNRLIRLVIDSAGITIGAYCFTLPLLMFENGWISLVAPIANILITPFVMPMLLGGIFCAVLPVNPLPVRVAAVITDFCTGVVLKISELLARLCFATISIDRMYIVIGLAGVVVFAAVLIIVKADKRLVATAALLCVLIFSIGSVTAVIGERGKIELVTLSGCDAALLIRERSAVILGYPDRYDAAKVLAYLDYRGIGRISCIVASDMTGSVDSGLLRVGSAYDVSALIGPDDLSMLDQLARALKGVPAYPSGYASVEVLDGASLTFSKTDDTMEISVAGTKIRKVPGAYVQGDDPGAACIYSGGELYLPEGLSPVIEPVGAALYGETRLVLPL